MDFIIDVKPDFKEFIAFNIEVDMEKKAVFANDSLVFYNAINKVIFTSKTQFNISHYSFNIYLW